MSVLKRAYVAGARVARQGARRMGLLAAWERQGGRSRLARWARSLFAIYDLDDMVRLDLPWWTLGAVDRVDAFLRTHPDARVFEYGSGASTIWLARRAGQVISVEHDATWHELLSHKAHDYPNIDLLLRTPDVSPLSDRLYASRKSGWTDRTFYDYVHAIDSVDGVFDAIVIDGRARPACLALAKERLAPDGMIVFDNSHRPPYRRAIEASGLQAARLGGLTACLPYPDETTLLRHG